MELIGRKIQWHPKSLKISQIPKDGMEFAFVSEDYKQIHQLVWCKDFMQDAIFAFVNKQAIEIYGFKYDPALDPPIFMDKTRMLICNWKDQEFETKLLKNCRDFINQFETALGFEELTTFEKCLNPPPIYRKSGVFIINASKRWMIAPPMVSLYTLLLRIGVVHTLNQKFMTTLEQIQSGSLKPYNWKPDTKGKYGNDHTENDADFLKNGWLGMNRILVEKDTKIFHKKIESNYPEKIRVYGIHENSGLGCFSQGYTKSNFPHWHKNKE